MNALLVAAALLVQDQMKPLDWLVGTWEGKGKINDVDFTETATYEWTHNKNFIKWTAEARVDGKVVHSDTGMMGYDAAKKKLVWFSFNLDGTIGHAEERETKDKDTWVFHASVGDKAPWNDSLSIMRKIDADTFENEVQVKKGDGYESFFKETLKRKK